MEKPSLNLNEYLRYFIAGAVSIICYLFLNPDTFEKIDIRNNSLTSIPLALASFVFGALIYSVHRALLYPCYYRFMFIIRFIVSGFRRNRWDWGYLIPVHPSETQINEDFRRWRERRIEKSFSNDLKEWASQVHFLYCSALAILIGILLTKVPSECKSIEKEHLCIAWIVFGLLFLSGIIHHYRYLVYDLQTGRREERIGSSS